MLPAVGRLRAASLLEESGPNRVRLPGPARTYAERYLPAGAWDQYGPTGVVYYLAVTEAADGLLGGAGYGVGLDILLTELPNLHAFADWGLAQAGEGAAQAARLVGALRNLYMLLSWPGEGVARLQRATEAAHRAGDAQAEANTLQAIGDVQQFRDEREAALESYGQALGLFRAVGARLGEANTLQGIGRARLAQGDEKDGLANLEQAAALYETVGDRAGASNVHITLARLAAAKGDLQTAIAHLQPAADFGKAIGHPLGDQLQAQIDAWREQLKN